MSLLYLSSSSLPQIKYPPSCVIGFVHPSSARCLPLDKGQWPWMGSDLTTFVPSAATTSPFDQDHWIGDRSHSCHALARDQLGPIVLCPPPQIKPVSPNLYLSQSRSCQHGDIVCPLWLSSQYSCQDFYSVIQDRRCRFHAWLSTDLADIFFFFLSSSWCDRDQKFYFQICQEFFLITKS